MRSESPVLIDTTAFIDFHRGKESNDFNEIVLEDRGLLSPVVQLELLQGIKKDDWRSLEPLLAGFNSVALSQETHKEAISILQKTKNAGLFLTMGDLLIAAQAREHKADILSNDHIFEKLAKLKLIRLFNF